MSPAASDTRFVIPPKLPALTDIYANEQPQPVRFRPSTWEAALDGLSGRPTRLLSDRALTTEFTRPRCQVLGDRVVMSEAVTQACSKLNLDDEEAVVSAFVLVMAWGSGTRNGRSPRNTRFALKDPGRAAAVLRESAETLRATKHLDSPELLETHHRFALPGVGEPFFTKWFTFAGIRPGRRWQPLILDGRVRNTLHKTLDVWLNNLADKRRNPERYVGYLTAVHQWAGQLSPPMSAQRLEWILFRHNGKPI